MYSTHDCFNTPPDSTLIWRYMGFTKFVSLLEGEFLYFSRADRFDDPFEGSWPKMNIDHRFDDDLDVTEQLKKNLSFGFKKMRENTYINCWHGSEFESDAMWSLYAAKNEGIAILTTVGNLKESLKDTKKVYIGGVKYIDYDIDQIPIANNGYAPYLYKRHHFAHEKEIRAIVGLSQQDAVVYPNGIEVPINIEKLIVKVYVAPYAQVWFHKLIKSVLIRYGYNNIEVVQSSLKALPLY